MLAKPLYKLEQGHEVWPHLQLLLSPLCLSAVPEAFKAPSSVEHCLLPVPGPEEHTNLTGAAGLVRESTQGIFQILSCC